MSKFVWFTFKCVNAGRIDCLLVQLVPPFYNSIRKKCLLLSLMHLTFINLKEWPLVTLPLLSKWNKSSDLILLNPLLIWNTSIKSCLFLLSFNSLSEDITSLPFCRSPSQNDLHHANRPPRQDPRCGSTYCFWLKSEISMSINRKRN